MKSGGHGHSQTGTRGHDKIGLKKSFKMASGPGTKGGKSAKSATEYDCGCAGNKTGQPN